VLDWSDPPHAKWFEGGKLNVSANCLDRHVTAGKKDGEGKEGRKKTIGKNNAPAKAAETPKERKPTASNNSNPKQLRSKK